MEEISGLDGGHSDHNELVTAGQEGRSIVNNIVQNPLVLLE